MLYALNDLLASFVFIDCMKIYVKMCTSCTNKDIYICVCSMHPRLKLTLFKTLYSRGMCPIYLRLLMKIYEEQQMRIRWNNSVSDYFTISNGVKQGGVLSPVLFSIYLDQLIVQLRLLGMGYYMNGLFTGVFLYADDITLLAPSRASMVHMLKRCEFCVDTRHTVQRFKN